MEGTAEGWHAACAVRGRRRRSWTLLTIVIAVLASAILSTSAWAANKAPQVTKQPAGVTVEEGQSASFEAAASGVPAPSVQWQVSTTGGRTWANLAGATSVKYTIASAKVASSGNEYRAVFTNVAGKAASEAATLTVQKAPLLTKQPASVTVDEGEAATFEAAASGSPTPTVQWELSSDGGSTWAPVTGATQGKLTIASTAISEDGHQYRAVFTNAVGTATSATATLTVHSPPVVTLQPASTIVKAGEAATFEAAASGHPAPTVQWEASANGGSTWSAVPGATSNTLTIEDAQVTENGHEYRAVFTNAAGKATSGTATLTVASTRYSAVAWGQNLERQLGDGSLATLSNVPVQVSELSFVTAISAGGRHSLALLANGTVVAWGDNADGQLGDGTTTTPATPVAVAGLSGVKAIAAGANHSLALLSNGTVMAWGANESGQLGVGAAGEPSEVPVPVKGLGGVKAIAAGANDSLALLSNGTVMAWGENESGQLGDGSNTASPVPVAVKELGGVTAISAGGDFSLALLAKGTVDAWGSDQYGQLGDSAVAEAGASNVPVAVESLSGVTAISAGANHALALASGGAVMAWGEDNYGELGDGSITAKQEAPVSVSGLSSATAISAGGQDSVAAIGSGSVMAWGIDKWGTLGNGTTGNPSDVPVAVSGLGKAASVSAGGFHMVAFGEPLPAVTGVSPAIGPTKGGNTVTISGDNFTGVTSVRFGATAALAYTVESPTSIAATVPPGSRTVDATVTTASGTSPAMAADRYTYQPPPKVTRIAPASGPASGGTTVTITGKGFTGATSVSFGLLSASFKVNSPTSITATSPAASVGTVSVTVTTVGGTSAKTTKGRFKYT